MAVELMNFKQLQESFYSYCSKENKNISSIKDEELVEVVSDFLRSKNLDTSHVEDVIQILADSNPKISNIKIRKIRPTRDKLIKKRAIPLVTSLIIGSICGAAALLSSVATGSTFLGTTLIGDGIVDFVNVALVPFILGTVGCFGFIKLKNYVTIKYYEMKYGSASKCLSDLENGVDFENLEIKTLMDKIELSKATILSSDTNFFTKHRRNACNRNRIHHIEAVTIELMSKLNAIMSSKLSNEEKQEKAKNIVFMLEKINQFISNDIESSKVHALTNCEEAKEHTHTIENLDIYANIHSVLAKYKDIAKPVAIDKKELKTLRSNIKQKIKNANTLFNPTSNYPNLIQATLERVKASTLTSTTAEIVSEEIIAPATETAYAVEEAPVVKTVPAVEEVPAQEAVAEAIESKVTNITHEFGWSILTTEDGSKFMINCILLDSHIKCIATRDSKTYIVLNNGSEKQIKTYNEKAITKEARVHVKHVKNGQIIKIVDSQGKTTIISVNHTDAGKYINLSIYQNGREVLAKSIIPNNTENLVLQVNKALYENALEYGIDLIKLKVLTNTDLTDTQGTTV